MQAFIAGYCEISLIKSVSERRNYFEPGTDEYYNRKANTSSANTIGDVSSVEVFVNDGSLVFSTRIYPEAYGVTVDTPGANVTYHALNI